MNKNTKIIGCIIVTLIFILIACCGVAGFAIYSGDLIPDPDSPPSFTTGGGNYQSNQKFDSNKELIESISTHVEPFEYIENKRYYNNPSSYNEIKFNPNDINSISDIDPADNPLRFIQIEELVLLDSALEAALKTDWAKNGSIDSESPVNYKDLSISSSDLSEIANNVNQKKALIKPHDSLLPLFQSPESQDEINNVMKMAYEEFMKYLDIKDVNPKYIKTLKEVITPNNSDRLVYDADGFNSTISANKPYLTSDNQEYGFSSRYIELSSGSIYNFMKGYQRSGILGEVPEDEKEQSRYLIQLRDIAIRHLMYHEMMHSLQIAYSFTDAPKDIKTEKFISIYADKALSDLDKANDWDWSGDKIYNIKREGENITRYDEGAADGIAFEIVTNVYEMNNKQRDLLWSHLFGVKEPTRKLTESIKEKFDKNWDEVIFKNQLGEAMARNLFEGHPDKDTLQTVLDYSTSLPEYTGYVTPLTPEDSVKMWDALEN